MDQATKDALLERFRSYLEGLGAGADEPADRGDEVADLHSVFVEIAALRNEARVQSRLTKEALDQFRGVFETLRGNSAALEQQLKDAKTREKEQSRAVLRPFLLDIVDIRDRLAAAVAAPTPPSGQAPFLRLALRLLPSWLRPEAQASDPWREGLAMTLRRLDQALATRRVTPIALVGRPFQPALARAVCVVEDETVAEGTVTAELRAGFLFEDEVLRPAEVTVARRAQTAGRCDEGGN
ncbi:MAG: nucleotide exchange factor GrpE [Methylocystis sp.]